MVPNHRSRVCDWPELGRTFLPILYRFGHRFTSCVNGSYEVGPVTLFLCPELEDTVVTRRLIGTQTLANDNDIVSNLFKRLQHRQLY